MIIQVYDDREAWGLALRYYARTGQLISWRAIPEDCRWTVLIRP